MIWFALALALCRVPCVGLCADADSTNAPPCHSQPSQPAEHDSPACSHCMVANVAPSQTADAGPPPLPSVGALVASPIFRAITARTRAVELAAPSPPGLLLLSSTILRI
ncbi:MAG: hypothetical protein ACLP59_24520 [Bryobacteraceae bacterium]